MTPVRARRAESFSRAHQIKQLPQRALHAGHASDRLGRGALHVQRSTLNAARGRDSNARVWANERPCGRSVPLSVNARDEKQAQLSEVATRHHKARSERELSQPRRERARKAAIPIRVGPRKLSRQQLDVARGARDFALRTHENATAGVDAQLEECPLGHFDLT